MANINYDSFYKFLASLGIILVALPFMAILFLFTDSFNLQIPEADLIGYTKTAQAVIRLKQSVPLLIEQWYVWLIFIVFFIVGVQLIYIGLIKWHELQKIDDICKQLDMEKLKKEVGEKVEPMSDKEIMQNHTDDTHSEQITQNANSLESSGAVAMKSFLVEQRFCDFIKSTHQSSLVKHNIKIGRCEYDVVAFSTQHFAKDYVYEVKYMKKDITSSRIEQYREQMKKLKQTFSENFNRIPYMVLAIIVPDDVYEQALNAAKKVDKWNNYLINVIKESELSPNNNS